MALTRFPLSMLAICTLLAACGSERDSPVLGAARGLVLGLFDGSAAAPADTPQPLTRAAIDAAGVPLLLVEIETVGASIVLQRIGVNGPNETWAAEGRSVILSEEGVLHATRGLAADLMAADVEGIRAILRSGGTGDAQRAMVFLNGDLTEARMGFACTLTAREAERMDLFGAPRSLTRVTEQCLSATGTEFENRYWIDATGFAWVSDQWMGAEFGMMHLERWHR